MNLSPFLFVPLMLLYGLSYTQVGLLVLLNFAAQFAADLHSSAGKTTDISGTL